MSVCSRDYGNITHENVYTMEGRGKKVLQDLPA